MDTKKEKSKFENLYKVENITILIIVFIKEMSRIINEKEETIRTSTFRPLIP